MGDDLPKFATGGLTALIGEQTVACTLVILAAREGWHTRELTRALERARAHRGGRSLRRTGGVASARRPGLRSRAADLDRADAVLARIIPSGSLEQIIFRVDALHRLEDRGVRVDELAARHRADGGQVLDLGAARAVRAAHAGDRSSARAPEEAIAAFRALGDVIVKPLFGSMGLGMVRVSDEEMAFRVFQTIEKIRGVYYLQRTIDHEGRDIRAFVVGGRVLAAIERRVRRLAHQPRRGAARRGRSSCPDAWAALARAGGGRGRRRVRRGGPAAGARRHGVRARGQRHSRLGRAAAGHRAWTSPEPWSTSSAAPAR